MFSHSMLRRDAFALLRRAKVSLPLFAGLLLGGPVSAALGTDGDITRLLLGLALMALGYAAIKLIAPRLKKKGVLDMHMTPCGQDMKSIAMTALKPNKNSDNGGK